MKFKKQFLRDVIENYAEGATLISDYACGESRWSILHNLIFLFDGKFYESNYSVGATEMQDESPYEYEKDDIECHEVVPCTESVVVFRRK